MSSEINLSNLREDGLSTEKIEKMSQPGKCKQKISENVVMIDPLSKGKEIWDIFTCILLCYNGFAIPLSIAYDVSENINHPMFWLNRIVDFFFIVDVFANFFTGIFSGEKIIMDRVDVRNTYMRGWFLIDIFTVFPYELLVLLSYGTGDVDAGNSPTVYKSITVVHLLKLTRLFRVIHTLRIVANFQKALLYRYEDLAVINFCMFVVFCLHWSACIFSFLDDNICPSDEYHSIFVGVGAENATNGDKYVISLYWAFATMATIGYGDISARCTTTRVYSLVVMVVASVIYACGLSYIMEVIRKNRKHKEQFRDLMDMANNYMKFRNIPNELRSEIRMYFNFMEESEARKNDLLSEKLLLEELSPELRFAVLCHVNSGLLEKVKLFRDIKACIGGEDRFLQEMVLEMHSQIFRPQEIVVREGNDTNDELFFITKGTCFLVKWRSIVVDVLEEGDYYGEGGFLSHSAATTTEVGNKFRNSFVNSSSRFPVGNLSLYKESSGISVNTLSPSKSDQPKLLDTKSDETKKSALTYLQPYTLLTQTYTDLRYITRNVLNIGLNLLDRSNYDKVVKLMKKRLQEIVIEDEQRNKELQEKHPEIYQEFCQDAYVEIDEKVQEDDWRNQVGNVFEEESTEVISSNPTLRRISSRTRSNVPPDAAMTSPLRMQKHSSFLPRTPITKIAKMKTPRSKDVLDNNAQPYVTEMMSPSIKISRSELHVPGRRKSITTMFRRVGHKEFFSRTNSVGAHIPTMNQPRMSRREKDGNTPENVDVTNQIDNLLDQLHTIKRRLSVHPTSAILHKTMSPTEARKRKARYSDIVATPESNKYSEESGMDDVVILKLPDRILSKSSQSTINAEGNIQLLDLGDSTLYGESKIHEEHENSFESTSQFSCNSSSK